MLVTWCQVGWGGENDPQESADLMEEEEGQEVGGGKDPKFYLRFLEGTCRWEFCRESCGYARVG